jgi:ACS family glucarate transporter-like MFS transporter
MLARIGVGMGESAVLPCNAKIAANNFPSSERATVMAVALCGIRLGSAAAPIIMAFLIQRWGWREAFIVTGLGSLLWCVVWYFGFKESATNTTAAAKGKERVKVPWEVIATNKTLLNLTVVKFAQDYLMTVFTTWVPAYLIMGRGFSVVTMGFYMSAAYATSAISQPLVGMLSDWLIRRGWNLNRARKVVLVSLQLISSSIIITGFSDRAGVALLFLVVAISAEANCSAVTWTIISDVVPGKLVGSVAGAMNSIGAASSIIAPIVTGIIVKVTGSFQMAFTLGGCAMLVAAILTLFVVPALALQETLSAQGVPVPAVEEVNA